jgi:hypothetical protein
VLALALAGPLLTAVPAAAGRITATPWVLQRSPNANVPGGQINAVSRPAATACEAVGSYVNGSGTTLPLAESRNGTAWHLQHVSVPAGATVTTLTGVSCAAADCSNGADVWNGTSWSAQSTPDFSTFTSVSCVSADFCEAAGAGLAGVSACHRRYATVNCHEKAVDTAAGIWPGQSAHRPSDEEWSGTGSNRRPSAFQSLRRRRRARSVADHVWV